jgi:hypothetical protein
MKINGDYKNSIKPFFIYILKAFSMMVPKKRYWFVFNEENCELESYGCEKDFIDKKTPIHKVQIDRCAIMIEYNVDNQFLVL